MISLNYSVSSKFDGGYFTLFSVIKFKTKLKNKVLFILKRYKYMLLQFKLLFLSIQNVFRFNSLLDGRFVI